MLAIGPLLNVEDKTVVGSALEITDLKRSVIIMLSSLLDVEDIIHVNEGVDVVGCVIDDTNIRWSMIIVFGLLLDVEGKTILGSIEKYTSVWLSVEGKTH